MPLYQNGTRPQETCVPESASPWPSRNTASSSSPVCAGPICAGGGFLPGTGHESAGSEKVGFGRWPRGVTAFASRALAASLTRISLGRSSRRQALTCCGLRVGLVGRGAGFLDGLGVGRRVGVLVGEVVSTGNVGRAVGDLDGEGVGRRVGLLVGDLDGEGVGRRVGLVVGDSVGEGEGRRVGDLVGE